MALLENFCEHRERFGERRRGEDREIAEIAPGPPSADGAQSANTAQTNVIAAALI